MTDEKPPQFNPGYFPDDWPIRREDWETRLDDLAAAKVLPLRVVLAIGEVLMKIEQVVASDIETATEEALEATGDEFPVESWVVAFQGLCPELYGEPLPSKKISEAIPGSRSRIWRLEERYRCGLALHHARDTHGVRAERLPRYLWTGKMRLKAGLVWTPSQKETVQNLREIKPNATVEELAALAGCSLETAKRALGIPKPKPKEKAELVRDFLKLNPDASMEELCKHAGCRPKTVNTVWKKLGKLDCPLRAKTPHKGKKKPGPKPRAKNPANQLAFVFA